MTDRFQPPAPSPKAHAAAATIINDTVDQLGGFDAGGDALRAAYAIDLPAIVQREVLESLRMWCDPDLRTTAMLWYSHRYDGSRMAADEQEEMRRRSHLAARFGEGAQYIPCGIEVDVGVSGSLLSDPKAVRYFVCALPKGHTSQHQPWQNAPGWRAPAPSATAEPLTLRPEGRIIPGVPVPFTDSERTFLRDLANRNSDLATAQALLVEGKQ